MGYDVIVAGGGSAGCVAAARLSGDERRSVLLVEAGPDYPAIADLPADIADGSMPAASHDWGFASEPDELGNTIPLPRGRVIGGCSATNACFALRGWPQDYDQWAALGNPGWSLADLPTTPGYAGLRFQVMLTLRSSLAAPGGPPDLHLFPAGPFDDPASPAGGAFGIVAGLLAVRSRGSVRLRSASPADPPRIDTAHLRDPDDMARMIEATLHGRRISRTPPLAGFVTGAELAPGPGISDDDTAGLVRSIRQRVGSYHHPVGTCAMGPDPGDGAVVDARGAVHGVGGLWVADASVMPAIPAANTNLTAIVIAERIAQGLLAP